MAERVNANRLALYEIPEKKWVEDLGCEGQTIFRAMNRSQYGAVSYTLELDIDDILSILIEV